MPNDNIYVNYPDPRFLSKTSCIEIGYGIWVVMTVLAVGMTVGFTSVALPQIGDPESHIHASIEDKSWIASVISLSAPVGSIISGYLTDKLGRRTMLILCEVPLIIGWLITAFSDDAEHIIVGRLITGVGCGMALTPLRVYITEFSLPNLRGVIGAFPNLAMAMGISVQAIIGAMASWRILCWVGAIFNGVLICVNCFLPETPYFLLMKGDLDQAKKSLMKFRGSEHDIDQEMQELIEYKDSNNIRRLPFKEMLKAIILISACKPFWIIMIYVIIKNLAGVTAMTYWTVDILKSSHSNVDAKIGNILMSITRFFAGILCTILLYRVGRRPLSMVSGLGTGLFFIMMGLYASYEKEETVIPMLCALCYMVFATIGFHTIPMMLMSEMYPLQIRGILGGITLTLTNVTVFAATKVYPYQYIYLGYSGTLYFFGSSALLGCVFFYYFLPETRGLTLQEIEEYFNGLRSTLVSQRSVLSTQLQASKSIQDLNVQGKKGRK